MEEGSDADATTVAPHDVEASEVPLATPGGESETVDVTTALRRVNDAAREWGVRPHLMEGRFVSALTAAIAQMARVSDAARDEFKRAFQQNRDAAALELERAREITKAANISLSQARNALIGLEAERENAVVRMIHETLPLFADKLQSAIVIREKSWNDGQRFKRYAMVAAATVGLVAGGYTWRAWQDSYATTAMTAMADCLAHPLSGNGHLYCDVTSFSRPGK
jgi:hypothetical protein